MLNIVQIFSIIVPVIFTISGALMGVNTLNAKTSIGRSLMTDEQRIKVKYYNYIQISILLATTATFIMASHTLPNDISTFIGVFLINLALFLLAVPVIIMWIVNFCFKSHYKYKFHHDDLGDLYIIRMLDQETCICSTDANLMYTEDPNEYYLIPLEKVKDKKLIQEKITKPNRKFWQNLMDY
ncbi:hypothetical protein [Bacillus mesophilum]|uniref:Uncharacterized protein n=1 Tax=Bacillus mesophilum TaxID=1071718 RepID=A0A7V7RI38_9BACI|nr:hypothetical protein [Bacillus mesophilum]KAB2329431.1 hypothetical protein F7732_21130 [Bacillus mesophilum]